MRMSSFTYVTWRAAHGENPIKSGTCGQSNLWRAHSPSFLSLHLRHSSFSNPSLALPTSQLILQLFRCFTYITTHSPILLSLPLRHRIFTYVTWRASHYLNPTEKGVALSPCHSADPHVVAMDLDSCCGSYKYLNPICFKVSTNKFVYINFFLMSHFI